eukprot:evm.model.scf_1350.2 EVM.evm.TU.scf_1350.2   scf_1350:19092-19916(-)
MRPLLAATQSGGSGATRGEGCLPFPALRPDVKRWSAAEAWGAADGLPSRTFQLALKKRGGHSATTCILELQFVSILVSFCNSKIGVFITSTLFVSAHWFIPLQIATWGSSPL